MPQYVQLRIDKCGGCGESLEDGNANKRFHNAACRARFWRRKRDAQKHSEMAQAYIADIADLFEYPDGVEVARHALKEILQTCQQAVRTSASHLGVDYHEW